MQVVCDALLLFARPVPCCLLHAPCCLLHAPCHLLSSFELEPVVQRHVVPKRDPERAGPRQPATSRSHHPCFMHCPPFRSVRGSVADPSADIRARGGFELACRSATRRGRRCLFYRLLLLRLVATGSSAASSRLTTQPRARWLQPAHSWPPLASLHFEQLDHTLVPPPMALPDR